jgi:hypothetical protein
MIIDFQDWPLEKAMEYKECFDIVEKKVKPQRLSNTSSTQDNYKARKIWWQFASSGTFIRTHMKSLKKVIATSRVSKYRFFMMIENKNILPDCATVVITSSSFSFMGILSSKMHIVWVKHHSSTLGNGQRYTNTTCFETFPFPRAL